MSVHPCKLEEEIKLYLQKREKKSTYIWCNLESQLHLWMMSGRKDKVMLRKA